MFSGSIRFYIQSFEFKNKIIVTYLIENKYIYKCNKLKLKQKNIYLHNTFECVLEAYSFRFNLLNLKINF